MRNPCSRQLCSWNGLKTSHHYIPVTDLVTQSSYELYLLQIQQSSPSSHFSSIAPVCFLLHGGLENGKIFYSKSGKGFGPYLAKLGYNVFIGDLRGKGNCKPLIKHDKNPNYGIKDVTERSIPLFLDKIISLTGQEKLCWVSHSLGGVLLKSTLARYPKYLQNLQCEIHFATKRVITERNFLNWLILDLFYGQITKGIFKIYGYLPSKKFKIGSDDETFPAYQTAYHWIHPKTNQWIDREDGFAYHEEYSRNILAHQSAPPPALVFTSDDDVLAAPGDVKLWCEEVGIPLTAVVNLSEKKEEYQQQKYNHFSMLTHPSCENHHFKLVKEFLEEHFPIPTSSFSSP
jgi:predicted alpha/beta hydrolase